MNSIPIDKITMNLMMMMMNLVYSSIFSEEDLLKMYLWDRLNLVYKLPTMKHSEETTLTELSDKLYSMKWPEFELTMRESAPHHDKYFFFGIAMCVLAKDGQYHILHNENHNMIKFVHTPPADIENWEYYREGKNFGRAKLSTLFKRYLKEFEKK